MSTAAFIADLTGWIGAILLLGAYLFVSSRRLSGDGAVYQLLNIGGAGLLTFNSAYHAAWPSVALNGIWIGIGIVILARAHLRRAARA